MIVAAEGVWFTDDRGRQVLDGHSGLWTTGLGHGREEIAEAVSQQVRALDFAPPFQYGHPKAFALANKIKSLMPGNLDYVFFYQLWLRIGRYLAKNGAGVLAAEGTSQ